VSKRAFLFPGQASQYIGMGKDLCEEYPLVKDLYDQANQIMGVDLKKICFEGPEEELKQTKITQPAIFVHSVAVYRILHDIGVTADAAAGHSLGEYSALIAAGALEFADGLHLVKIRGELMQQAGVDHPGTMAAIIGLDPAQIQDICEQVPGIVCPANYNSPGQVAISGEIEAVHSAMDAARDKGAKKAIELVVSGAFHSPLMSDAQQGLTDALAATLIADPNIPVYSNVEATPASDATHIRELLGKQLLSPVRWTEIIENMVRDGIESFIEVGPGKVLSGLNRRIVRELECQAIGTVADIQSL
jgi:[acyl-carrier-protein] S-malonyltransferase